MNTGLSFIAAAVLLSAVPAAQAASFTSKAAFLANMEPGYYLEDFNGLPGYTYLGSPVSFSGNGYSYDATNPGGVYTTTPDIGGDIALAVLSSGQAITITFTGGTVTAVGGNLYGSDAFGGYTPGAMTVQLDNGESITISDPDPASFAGFITSTPIVSLSLFPENFNSGYWPTLDNLIVGQAAVPAPSTFSLMAAGSFILLGPACARWNWGRAASIRA